MKLTFSSLKEFLETSASLEDICEKLTNIGLEVESVEDKAKILGAFSVAKILDTKPHENSSKLKICLVEIENSKQPLQIVCGSSNARKDLKVAYAPIGSVIPANQMVIRKAKIAGVESNGMLCSASELGLGSEDSGIIEIDQKWPVGTKITEIFSLNDAIIEINITPNRGDCLGVYGIARDLAASEIGKLKKFGIEDIAGKFSFPFEISNKAPDACSYAAFRYIRNVKNCESPKWLKEKLEAVGMNSISAIVDITNYVMHVLNRPMHAYDAAKITFPLQIRYGKESENFTSLKDEKFTLDNKTLVIADSEKSLGIAGIIGSSNSSCNHSTTEILLESAFFNPSRISYSGRKLNIASDARQRFERGVDEETCKQGIDLATKLILEICGGQQSEIKFIGQKSKPKKILFDETKIRKLIGSEVSPGKARQILSNLGFIAKDNKVEIPSHRHDIFSSEDLVEEIIRINGYEKIAAQPLPNSDHKSPSCLNSLLNKTRISLASTGLTEIMSWSFVDSKLVEIFGEKNSRLTLANPISSEMDHMRPTLAIGLIEAYKQNSLRNFHNLALFEIGNVFLDTDRNQDFRKPQFFERFVGRENFCEGTYQNIRNRSKNFSDDESAKKVGGCVSHEKLMVAGLRAGNNKEQNHYHDERESDVFDVKKDFFEITKIFGLRRESLQILSSEAPKYYHPHRSCTLKLGKNTVGFFGELHPITANKFDLKVRINLFEIFIDNLPTISKSGHGKAFVINNFPVVERDFAFLVDRNLATGDLIKTISDASKELIREVKIFDIFAGKNIAEDKKSVAIRIKIQSDSKTLTSEEIDLISKKLIESVEHSHNGKLRNL